MTLRSVKLWAGIYRKIIAFSFSPFLSLLLSFEQQRRSYRLGFVRRGTTSPALRRVWVLSLPDFVSGYVCCLFSTRAGTATPVQIQCSSPFIHTHRHQRPVCCRTFMYTDMSFHTHTHTHVYMQHSAPEKLPSNPLTSLCANNRCWLLSGPPLRLCWW